MPKYIRILQDANGVWNVDLDTLHDGRKNRISGTLQQCLRACQTYEPDKHVEWVSWFNSKRGASAAHHAN